MLPHTQGFISSSQYANVICRYILQIGSPGITSAQVNQHDNLTCSYLLLITGQPYHAIAEFLCGYYCALDGVIQIIRSSSENV